MRDCRGASDEQEHELLGAQERCRELEAELEAARHEVKTAKASLQEIEARDTATRDKFEQYRRVLVLSARLIIIIDIYISGPCF